MIRINSLWFVSLNEIMLVTYRLTYYKFSQTFSLSHEQSRLHICFFVFVSDIIECGTYSKSLLIKTGRRTNLLKTGLSREIQDS